MDQESGLVNTMDVTFISIHDLTPDARILYSSDSIVDLLGYTPDEVVNQSAWNYFPQEELPYAKEFHQHGVNMDRAAMLSYCRVKNKAGEWIGCECCFTIVYDVMVVCTSIYRRGLPSQKRAAEAPVIRRLFSSSPKDPRYHMLSHISQKFQQPTKSDLHEPRAALFLNRFTRTLTIMYATSGLEDVIGIPADTMRGRSFYYCIAENCLQDAVKCLETAKGNDSIAYLRFWFRDPRADDANTGNNTADDSDEEMVTDSSVDQDFSGGVGLNASNEEGVSPDSDESSRSRAVQSSNGMDVDDNGPQSRTSSGDSMYPSDTHEAIFGASGGNQSSASSAPTSPDEPHDRYRNWNRRGHIDPVELEAVISCASDGLVVCLRKARPLLPQPTSRSSRPAYENGLFAAPWGEQPMVPPLDTRPPQHDHAPTFAPSLGPQGAHKPVAAAGGPQYHDFMASIRDQAIFAWALTGINGSLQKFSVGTPHGESLPPQGLPVWQSDQRSSHARMNDRTDSASSGIIDGIGKPPSYSPNDTAVGGDSYRKVFGDPGLQNNRGPSASNGQGSHDRGRYG